MNPEMEKVALTSSIDTFDDFVDELAELLSIRPFVPFYTYLIYDDCYIYAESAETIENCRKNCLIFQAECGIMKPDYEKEVPGMNYEIRHFDTPLLRFSATEDTARPEIEILWNNEDARQLIPLDLTVSPEPAPMSSHLAGGITKDSSIR